MRAFNRESKILDPETLENIFLTLSILTRAWTTRIQKGVFATFESLITNAMDEARGIGDVVGLAFDLSNESAIEFIRNYSFSFAQQMAETSQKIIKDTILKGQTEGLTVKEQRDELLKQFDSWNRIRAENVARSETIRASNAGAVHAYQASDVQIMEWLASDDACPFCDALNGKRILVSGGTFLKVGETMTVETDEGIKRFTNTYEDVSYPPIHVRCRCTVIPIIE